MQSTLVKKIGTGLAALTLAACQPSVNLTIPFAPAGERISLPAAEPAASFSVQADAACSLSEPLRAGQTINIGSVTVRNDASHLYVTYSTTGDWRLKATHINVATSLAAVPVSGGGAPVNGQFTRQTSHSPLVSSFTYKFALADYQAASLYILTHAEAVRVDAAGNIVQSETAYGGSQDWPLGKRWAYFTQYTPCKPACPVIQQQLRAGQTIGIGSISLWNDAEKLYVKYTTTGDWRLQRTHVNVSTSLAGVPVSGGGAPINGKFTAQTSHSPAVAEFTYSFPLASYASNTLTLMTHAEAVRFDAAGNLLQGETAYGGDLTFPSKRWAYFANYQVCR